jgi:hypothetical protein
VSNNPKNNVPRGDQPETRSLTTDAAILLAPALAVGTKVALDQLTNRPKDETPKVDLPPGVEKEK